MGTDVEDAMLAPAGLDAFFEAAVMTRAPGREVAEGEVGVEQERAVTADKMRRAAAQPEAPPGLPVEPPQEPPS